MVSPRKPATSISPAFAPRPASKLMASSAKSCESLFSASSSRESACLIYQRKQPQVRGAAGMKSSSGHGPARQPSMAPNSSDIHQRVMSARNLRIKTFQNQLADAQAEIANLAHENRMLRTLHKRQSSALDKYESTNAELPQLLHSHAEELRVWQTKYRNLQSVNKELEQKLKQKEAYILSLSDQNKHYSQLNKDKSLDERQRLQEKLRSLEQQLLDKDNDMKLMARKVQLESKNFRQQLLNEQKKSKEVLLKLEKARLEVSGYRKLEEFTLGAEKTNPLSAGRRAKLTVVEEPDKIDKLEKSLETLEKAIEKNNQSEFNALTDVLETDSLFDFEKEEADNKNANPAPQSANKDSKLALSKFTLPPASAQPKPPQQPLSKRSALSQALSSKQASMGSKLPTPMSRLRSGGSSGLGKHHDVEALAKIAASEAKSKQRALKSLELSDSYDEEYEDAPDGSDSFGLVPEMCNDNNDDDDNDHDDDDDGEEENANEASLVNYAAYKANGELDDMLEEEDEEDDAEANEQMMLKTNLRAPTMKEDMSSIRKQISDDYKERESFLNTFCRQASSSNMREDPAQKKRNSIATSASSHMAGSRKHALLAALKAIDDNKSQD